MTTNYTKVADICNAARPDLFHETLKYIEDAVDQAIQDVDADYLETLMDAFSDDDIGKLEGIENVKDLIEHWKNIVMGNALKEHVEIMTNIRIYNWDRKVKLDQEYYKEKGQI